jgi:hypothetical protein
MDGKKRRLLSNLDILRMHIHKVFSKVSRSEEWQESNKRIRGSLLQNLSFCLQVRFAEMNI